jgi:hypothetical protein
VPLAPESPVQSIVRAANLYHRGIICPGETWNQILDAVGGAEVGPILGQLTLDEQRSVKAIYSDRPRSLSFLAESRPASESQVTDLLRWCEDVR